jgi:hypothetical protein
MPVIFANGERPASFRSERRLKVMGTGTPVVIRDYRYAWVAAKENTGKSLAGVKSL